MGYSMERLSRGLLCRRNRKVARKLAPQANIPPPALAHLRSMGIWPSGLVVLFIGSAALDLWCLSLSGEIAASWVE